nr:FKBP12-interacting protein of 37 kDa [Ipomoea batatas]
MEELQNNWNTYRRQRGSAGRRPKAEGRQSAVDSSSGRRRSSAVTQRRQRGGDGLWPVGEGRGEADMRCLTYPLRSTSLRSQSSRPHRPNVLRQSDAISASRQRLHLSAETPVTGDPFPPSRDAESVRQSPTHPQVGDKTICSPSVGDEEVVRLLPVRAHPMASPNHLDDGLREALESLMMMKRIFLAPRSSLFQQSEVPVSSGNIKVEETAPGAATGTILSLRESLKDCKETLATCQSELEAAKSEILKWHSSFQKESFMPSGTTPEPKIVINYLQNLRSSEELLREQLEKAKKKEAAFIVNIAKRDQEIAELKSAVRDLRAQLKPPSMQARKLLLDPAIHEEFTRLKEKQIPLNHCPGGDVEITTSEGQNLVEEKDKKVKELQDNINAVNFTPQSKMGKMLMAKCRTLQEENEEIGNQANEGKMHELAMKLALQKSQNAELKGHFEGLCKQVEGLTNDVEISNEMVFMLQEKLEEKDMEIRRIKKELEQRGVKEEPLEKTITTEEKNELSSDDKIATNEGGLTTEAPLEDS